MRQTALNIVTDPRWQYLVIQKERNNNPDIMGKILQNFPYFSVTLAFFVALWVDLGQHVQARFEDSFLGVWGQVEDGEDCLSGVAWLVLTEDIFKYVHRYQSFEFFLSQIPEKALEFGKGIEHLWFIIVVGIQMRLTLIQDHCLGFIGMDLKRQTFLNTQNFKEVGKRIRIGRSQKLRQFHLHRILAGSHRDRGFTINMNPHPHLRIVIKHLLPSQSCDSALVIGGTPCIILNRVILEKNESVRRTVVIHGFKCG